MIFNRQPVYPMDTLLQDREHFYGEDVGLQMIEKMHKIFKIMKRNVGEIKVWRQNKNMVIWFMFITKRE